MPSADALEHSARVAARVRERLAAAGGWLDFADYMQLVLYEPTLGYYSAGAGKFGPSGDFVTAPEISPLFARCLARACAPLLGEDGAILELGAGSGVMAAALISALERLRTPLAAYLILEVSADLRERQRATLARLAPQSLSKIRWLERLPDSPQRCVVVANEVADALPVSRFRLTGDEVLACGVTGMGEGFGWSERPAGDELRSAVAAIGADVRLAAPYESEVCLPLPLWIAAIAAALADGSVFLLADYGGSRQEYYHPQRRDGTLRCHYRHRAHGDPFIYPGLQDITAWVDFSAVAAAAARSGLDVAGYATQAHFLLDCGLEEELAAQQAVGGAAALRAASEAKTLLLPGEMGERCKVMALTRGAVTPRGFGFRDLRHLL